MTAQQRRAVLLGLACTLVAAWLLIDLWVGIPFRLYRIAVTVVVVGYTGYFIREVIRAYRRAGPQ